MNGKSGFLNQIALLVAIIVGVFTVILPLYSPDPPVSSQVQSNSEDIENRVDEIERQIDQRVFVDKICTESNPYACSALFDRLEKNVTRRQRRILACGVLRFYDPATVKPRLPCGELGK